MTEASSTLEQPRLGMAAAEGAADTTPDRTLQLRVVSIAWETEAVRTVELRPANAGSLPAFTAGAHVTLHLPGSIQRSYSLMNAQDERHRYVLGVALDRASRGGSRYMHEQVRPGSILNVSPPRNLFALAEDARSTILIGGGIGITPLLSMAARLHALGRDWSLHYASRSRAEAPFLDRLEAWGDHAKWHGDMETGSVLDISAIVREAEPGTHFYCCGPASMLAAFESATSGLPAAQVHIERFAPAAAPASDGGYVVELARSGKVVRIMPGQTILQAVHAQGISAPSSCLQGVCGACETRVLAGIVDHRDAVLSAAERSSNSTMMICCSGAQGERLVLDL